MDTNKEIQAVKTTNKNHKLFVERAKNLKYFLCEEKGMDVFSFRFEGSKLEILVVYLHEDEDNSLEV